jgi:hypothetical protein
MMKGITMSDLFLLSPAQMSWIEPFFPRLDGVACVDAPLVLECAEHVFDLAALLIESRVVWDRDLQVDLDGMHGVIPRATSALLNQYASYPRSASNKKLPLLEEMGVYQSTNWALFQHKRIDIIFFSEVAIR